MKKRLTLLTALIACLSCAAAPLSPEQALQRVTESKGAKKLLGGDMARPELVLTGKTALGSPAYYVFTQKAGTLFVSAEDSAEPLLGYSENGDFNPDNMPPQLKWWLNKYAEEIAYYTNLRPENKKKTLRRKKAAPAQRSAIAPMLKTTWDQTEPYDKYCPEYSGERTVTGCVATAMAQAMKYYAWPQTTVEPISYQWNSKTLTSPSVTLDWANMLDSYQGRYTTAQADAVARLMQVAGYSVKMQYNIAENGGSGAYSDDIRNALVNNFGYDIACDYIRRDFYTAEEWEAMLYDNLMNVGPVIYGGQGSEGGHQFVCDGYDGAGAFHINWGWSGIADGYFRLNALDPDDLGTGGGDGGFNWNQDMILGMRRPQAGSVAPAPVIGCSSDLVASVWGYELSLESSDGYIWNISGMGGNFTFGVSLTSVETGTTTYCEYGDISLEPGYSIGEIIVNVPSYLPDGTYVARPVYKVDNGAWSNVRFAEGCTDSVTITLTGSGIEITEDPEEQISLYDYICPTGLVIGQPYKIDLTVKSSYSYDVNVGLDAYLCSWDDVYFYPEEELGYASANVPANSMAVLTYSGTLSNYLTPGTYALLFTLNDEIVDGVYVDVVERGDEAVIYKGLSSYCNWTFENTVMPQELDYIWNWDEDHGYLKGSAYVKKAYAAESWAVSPVIDLSEVKNATVNFSHTAKFQTTLQELCGFYVREVGGEWEKLHIANWPEAGNWTFVEAGEMSLQAYAGKKIQVAAKYGSSMAGADTWEIKDVIIKVAEGETPVDPDPVIPTPAGEYTLNIADATDIRGEFNQTKYKDDGAVQEYANYKPLDLFEIDGYRFLFRQEDESASAPALYMDADGEVPQTLRLYKTSEMTVMFPAGAKVESLTWNFKSISGVDYVYTTSGEATVLSKDKKLVWTNTDGVSEVVFTLPYEKGSDNKNPNVQIVGFDVVVAGTPVVPDPIENEYIYVGLTDNCDWTFVNEVLPEELDHIWSWDERYGCLKASAYVSGEALDAESWAVSPEIDLTRAAGPTVNFDHAAKFQTTIRELCGFYVREVGGAWEELRIANWPEAGTWDFVEAGEMSLQAYVGKKIQLAFLYGSYYDGADTWEVRNVVVKDAKTGIDTVESGFEGETLFFDLNGRRVEKPSAGLYIMVRDGKPSKIMVK